MSDKRIAFDHIAQPGHRTDFHYGESDHGSFKIKRQFKIVVTTKEVSDNTIVKNFMSDLIEMLDKYRAEQQFESLRVEFSA